MRLWKDPNTGTAGGGHSRWKTGVMTKSSGSDYFSKGHDIRGESALSLPPPPGLQRGQAMGTGTGMGMEIVGGRSIGTNNAVVGTIFYVFIYYCLLYVYSVRYFQ